MFVLMFGVVDGSFLSKHQRNQQEFYRVPKAAVHKREKKLNKLTEPTKDKPDFLSFSEGYRVEGFGELEPVSTLGSKS